MRAGRANTILVGMALAACASTVEAFERYDADENALLDEAEFRIGARDMEYFGMWDADDSGFLDDTEIERGLDRFGIVVDPSAAAWDTDGDGAVSEDEFLAGAFAMLDADRDDALDREELEAGIEIGDTP